MTEHKLGKLKVESAVFQFEMSRLKINFETIDIRNIGESPWIKPTLIETWQVTGNAVLTEEAFDNIEVYSMGLPMDIRIGVQIPGIHEQIITNSVEIEILDVHEENTGIRLIFKLYYPSKRRILLNASRR